MKIMDRLRRQSEHVMSSRETELSGWRRPLRRGIDASRFCWRRLKAENAPAMSAALSFRTIFALIPALVLAGVFLNPFGLLEQSLNKFLAGLGIEQIVVSNPRAAAPGAPTVSLDEPPVEVLMLSEKIQDLVGTIQRKITYGGVGLVGVLLLVWTVIALLTAMEKSLNRIFGARRVRPFGKRMMLYWSVVTLCPLLLVAAIFVGGASVRGLGGLPVVRYLVTAVVWVAPLLIGVLLLALVYRLMPNTQVVFRAALIGAAVAVPLFALAKWGFSLYVARVVAHGSLYGALGLLPLFLIWVNVSWMLFLVGAVLAHTLANFTDLRASEGAEVFIQSPSARVAAAVVVAKPYEAGQGPQPLADLASRLGLPVTSVERLMDKLVAMRIVARVESPAPAYVLTRPAAKIPMTELLEIDPQEHARWTAEYDPEIAAAVETFRGRARGALANWTLADFLAEAK
jgi:membrane protein